MSVSSTARLELSNKRIQGRRNIVICTTSIISGNRMMDAAIETGSYAKDRPSD